MNSGIYKITHKDTGRVYIGQSTRLSSRISQYKSCHKRKKKTRIENAISKYGWDAFEFNVLVYAEGKEYLNLLEQRIIEGLDTLKPNGFNLRKGGNTSTFCKETRDKMSAIKIEQMKNPEVREKLRQHRLNQIITPESYKKQAQVISSLVWMNDGKRSYRIKPDLVEKKLNEGLTKGRLHNYINEEYRQKRKRQFDDYWASVKSKGDLLCI